MISIVFEHANPCASMRSLFEIHNQGGGQKEEIFLTQISDAVEKYKLKFIAQVFGHVYLDYTLLAMTCSF